MDEPERAMKYLEFLMKNDQTNMTAYSAMRGNIDMINTMKSNLLNSPDDIELINALARIYLQLGYKDAAGKYLNLALKVDPKNAGSLTLLKEAEALPGNYN
jgi:tetratricopeptide (TPR) repeat protein